MLTTVGVLAVLTKCTKCGNKKHWWGRKDITVFTDSVITPNTAHETPTMTTWRPHKIKHTAVSYMLPSCTLCKEYVNMHWTIPRQMINTAADINTLDINTILLPYTAGVAGPSGCAV
jgi:hypothetical protein